MDRQIFVSYCWRDEVSEQHFARAFASELREYNVNVWIDYRELKPGEPIEFRVAEAIKSATHFVIFLSRKGWKLLSKRQGGFTIEVEKIITVRNARQRNGLPTEIVLVVLDSFDDYSLTLIPQLMDIASTLRIDASREYSKMVAGGDTCGASIAKVYFESVLGGQLRLFPRGKVFTEEFGGVPPFMAGQRH